MSAQPAPTALADVALTGTERRRLVRPGTPGSFGLSGVIHESPSAPQEHQGRCWAILVPGWAGDRCGPGEIFLPMAGALLQTDAKASAIDHVLRFDVHGRGESRGDYVSSDLDAMVDDGLRALAVVSVESGAREGAPVDIHLIGMCSGGNVALGIAGLWARMQALDEYDLAHLDPAIVMALRTVRLKTVQAISTFPFQEMRPEELNTIRQQQNRRKSLGKLFQAESYKKLLSGRLNPTRILKNWFESEPGKSGSEAVNQKLSRRDLLACLAVFAKLQPGALQFLYADGDPEGAASIPVYQAFFQAQGAQVQFQTLPGCNHNFYGLPARAKLFPAVCGFIA